MNDQTGLNFESVDDAKQFYDSNKPADAPDFSEEVLAYFKGLGYSDKWEDIVARADAQDDIVSRSGDLFAACYPAGESERGAFQIAVEHQSGMDRLLAETKDSVNLDRRVPEWIEVVFQRFVELLPTLGIVSTSHDTNTAEWHWAPIRCVLAGAGYGSHKRLAKLLCDRYPLCDLDPGETKSEWRRSLESAHKLCGWPVQLAWIDFKSLHHVLGYEDPDHAIPERWLKVIALFHVLKHLRWSYSQGAVLMYRSTARKFPETCFSAAPVRQDLIEALGSARIDRRKKVIPVASVGLETVLKQLRPELLLARSLTAIPSSVLHGPWTTLYPSAEAPGFTHTGLRLAGAWQAVKGTVSPYTGTESALLEQDWLLGAAQDFASEHEEYRAAMPDTYQVGFPFENFAAAFANIDLSMYPAGTHDAVKVLFDLPVFAALLRPKIPRLRIEYPMVFFQPVNPDLNDSTNQGKTLAAVTLGRAMFGVTQATSVKDSSSAPDVRALADEIRTQGSVVLDEWRPPKSKNHLLSHENLQSLCTGGAVTSGLALENKNQPVRLAHSLVISCKAVDFPPDMVNRSLFWWLSPLTMEQRDNADVLDQLRSGRIAMSIRLGALAIIDAVDLPKHLEGARMASGAGLRFEAHNALAKLLFYLRTGRPENGEIDAAIAAMRDYYEAHTEHAVNSGVMDLLETSRVVSVRLASLVSMFGPMELEQLQTQGDYYATLADRNPDGMTARDLLRTLQHSLGIGGPFNRLMARLTGGGAADASDKAIVASLETSIRSLLPDVGHRAPLPGIVGVNGWVFERRADRHGSPQIRIVDTKASPAAEISSSGVDEALPQVQTELE